MKYRLLKFLKSRKYNFLFAIVFAVAILLPDFIFELVFPGIKYLTDYLFIIALVVFGFILSFTGIVYFSLVLLLLFVIQSIQLLHIAYFSRPINPLDISKIVTDFSDVYNSGVADLDDFGFVIPLIIITFGTIFFTFFKYRRQLGFSILAIIIITVALGVKPERAMRKTLKSFLPADTRYSVHNSINTFSYFLVTAMDGKTIDSIVPDNLYKPYVIEANHNQLPKLIVLVMGESLNSEEMSLYNAQIPLTTPNLESLKDNPKFLYLQGMAGAVSTHSALPIFFNMMKEPGNIELFKTNEANLFKLAKQSGYTTHFLSAYDVKQTHNIGVPYVDDIRTSEQNILRYSLKKEDHMVELFQEMDLSEGQHFVVLNFKGVHSPYESNYAHRKAEFSRYQPKNDTRKEEVISSYRNAVLYIDDVIKQLMVEFNKKAKDDGYFILTSDHGELLGQNDYYGHNILKKETALVPFAIYSNQPDKKLYQSLKKRKDISHYEMGKMIASLLGYEVTNPNSDKNVSYIHGNNLYEEYEVLGLKRQENQLLQQNFQGSVSSFIQYRYPNIQQPILVKDK